MSNYHHGHTVFEANVFSTSEEDDSARAERLRWRWVHSVHEMIADEPHPHGVRVSVQPSRETEGAAEIHLFTNSPYHLSVIKVPAGAQNVEGLYGAGLMQHERAVRNLGGGA